MNRQSPLKGQHLLQIVEAHCTSWITLPALSEHHYCAVMPTSFMIRGQRSTSDWTIASAAAPAIPRMRPPVFAKWLASPAARKTLGLTFNMIRGRALHRLWRNDMAEYTRLIKFWCEWL